MVMLPSIPDEKDLPQLNAEWQAKMDKFRKEWSRFYNNISKKKTPKLDGTGREIIKTMPGTGYDYIIDTYMEHMLDEYFPGWSTEQPHAPQLITPTMPLFVVSTVTLKIIDIRLTVYGINPPYRCYTGSSAARVMWKKDTNFSNPRDIVDLGNNVKASNTDALKYCINRLTHIGDDVYGRRYEDEGSGDLTTIIMQGGDLAQNAFNQYVKEKGWSWGNIIKALSLPETSGGMGIKSLSDIKDFAKAKKVLDDYIRNGGKL